jgi:hypothetical protein
LTPITQTITATDGTGSDDGSKDGSKAGSEADELFTGFGDDDDATTIGDGFGEAQPYATRAHVRAWASRRRSPRRRRESGYSSTSPDFSHVGDSGESHGTNHQRLPVLLPPSHNRSDELLLADSMAMLPSSLQLLLEEITARLERAGCWDNAVAITNDTAVLSKVQGALDASGIDTTEIAAAELLAVLLSSFE